VVSPLTPAEHRAGPPGNDADGTEEHTDSVEATLYQLLAAHPAALVAAVGGLTTPERVALPASLAVETGHRLDDDSALLEQVVPEDRAVIAKLWGKTRVQGAAVAPVRLVADPGQPSNLYMLDLRRRHGVIVLVYTPGDDTAADHMLQGVRLPALPPRLAHSRKDAAALVTWVDAAFCQMLGWRAGDVIGRRINELVHPDDREGGIANWMEMLDSPGPARPVRLRHLHQDGSWVWIEVTNNNRLADPEHHDVLAEMVDISEEMGALEALHAREQLLRQLTETVPVGLFHADLGGNLLFSNSRLGELTGVRSVSGTTDLLAVILPEDRDDLDRAVAAALAGADADVEVRIPFGSDWTRYCTFRLRPLLNDSGAVVGLTGCIEDVTAAVHTRQSLQTQAATDQLTGCLNRTAALAVLQDALDGQGSAAPSYSGTAVIFLDLDQFKPVNDRFGHAAGDEALVRVAERIRASVRSGDVVGRVGGDEFLVVCPGIPTADQALNVASFLASRAFGQPIEVSGHQLEIRASLGVAWTVDDGTEATTMVRRADAAMYQAKRDDSSRPVLYRPDQPAQATLVEMVFPGLEADSALPSALETTGPWPSGA
jgi:diguanylate cyclase (GGDEF)-like protein/PAS domain S-box-containing protein